MFTHRLALPFLLVCLSPARAVTTETLAPGVYHDTYLLSDPNVVHVIRIDLSRPEYKLQLGFPQKQRNYTAKEGVSVISPRYEATGNHVIAAVNGSLFNVAPTDPGITGMLVDASGYLQMAPYDNSRARICFNDARTMAIEQNNSSSAPTVTFANTTSASIASYMMARASNSLACYMTTWGATIGTTNQGVEVIVSNVSYPIKPEKQVSGVVTAIRSGSASTNNAIPAGGMVLSGQGTAATTLSANVAVGDRIYLQTAISTTDFFWCNFALSGDGYLLSNGVPVQAGTTLDPQTVLAWNATNIFFMTVDGRQTSSIGMSWNGLATFLRNTVGATDALALDSGGSTTMWINGEGVVNSPSDAAGERPVADAVMLVNEPTTSVFPLQDNFTAAGRSLHWDDKFKYSAVSSFSPSAPGGDGYVMTVKNPSGGVDSARAGDLADINYTVQAQIYCEYRATIAANGYERCGIFARDNGNQAFTSTTYKGNCYAMIYKTDTGQVQAAKVVNGVLTDFLASSPIYLQVSGWHTFAIRCYSSNIVYLLDASAICVANDTTFGRGYCGIGYDSHYSSNSNIHGTRADNFNAFVATNSVPALLGIRLNASQSASLSITGAIGATYRIEFASELPSTSWTPLTNIFLSVSPCFPVDSTRVTNIARRFYRAVSVP